MSSRVILDRISYNSFQNSTHILSHTMRTLPELLEQYPILTSLSSFISTLDLYHLASTNKALHSYIQSPLRVFDILKRNCLCDGHGLTARQSCSGPWYQATHEQGQKRNDLVEVQLWNTVCDETGALPCRKCGINICEECRWYPRQGMHDLGPMGLSILHSNTQNKYVVCLCPCCDMKQEEALENQFLNSRCDCNIYTRWICWRCFREEDEFDSRYWEDRVVPWDAENRIQDHTIRLYDIFPHWHAVSCRRLCAMSRFILTDSSSITAYVVRACQTGPCRAARGVGGDICQRQNGFIISRARAIKCFSTTRCNLCRNFNRFPDIEAGSMLSAFYWR